MIELSESRLDFDRVREAKFLAQFRKIRDVSEICALRYGLKENLLMVMSRQYHHIKCIALQTALKVVIDDNEHIVSV